MAVELGDKVDVLYNAIYANQQDGVWVHQESPMTLRGNSISSNRGHGVITALTSSVSPLLLSLGWFAFCTEGLLFAFWGRYTCSCHGQGHVGNVMHTTQ